MFAQYKRLRAGDRAAMIIPDEYAGSIKNLDLPDNIKYVDTDTGIVLYDDTKLEPGDIVTSISKGDEAFMAKFLGKGAPKTADATSVQVLRDAAGHEINAAVSSPKTEPAVKAALEAQATQLGDVVAKEVPEDVLARRKVVEQLGGVKEKPESPALGAGPMVSGGQLKKFIGQTAKPVGKAFDWLAERTHVQPVLESIRNSLGDVGEKIVLKDAELRMDAARYFNIAKESYIKAYKDLTPSEAKRVEQAAFWADDHGGVPFTLTAKEQAALDEIHAGLRNLGHIQKLNGGPGINDHGHFREIELRENYVPNVMKKGMMKEIIEARADDPKLFEQRHQEFLDYFEFKTGDRAKGEEVWNNLLSRDNSFGANPGTPAFKATRVMEGIGVPPEWRMGLKDALDYHALRASTDLAFYKNIQSDPAISKVLGLSNDNGWGKPHPDVPGVNNEGARQDIQDLIADWDRVRQSRTDGLQAMTSFVLSNQLGFNASARDFITTMTNSLMESKGVGVHRAAKAIAEAFGGFESAFKGGALQRRDSASPDSQFIVGNLLNDWAERIRTYTGRTTIQNFLETSTYNYGKSYGEKLLSDLTSGNKRAQEYAVRQLDRFLGTEWKLEWIKDPARVADLFAFKFRESMSGSHRAADLPRAMLPASKLGPGEAGIRFLTTLSRWSVGRMNNWRKHVWGELEAGNPMPFIKSIVGGVLSAEAFEGIKEWLTGQKPPEMTWKEFVNSGYDDAAYTIAAKLQLTSGLGLLADAMWTGAQMSKGELKYSQLNNPALSAVTTMGKRLFQAKEAVDKGRNPIDMLAELPMQVIMDNNQNIRMLMQRQSNEETGDKGAREERLFNRAQGKKPYAGEVNPFLASSKIKRAASIPEASKYANELTKEIQTTAVVPEMKSSAIRKPEFYQYMSTLQGPRAAQEQQQRDVNREYLNRQKEMLIRQQAVRALSRENMKKWGY